MPASVQRAAQKDLNPSIGRVRCRTQRTSAPVIPMPRVCIPMRHSIIARSSAIACLEDSVASVRYACAAYPRNIAIAPALCIAVRIKTKSIGAKSDKRRPISSTNSGERQWKAEGVFGEAKGYHGLRRVKYRGYDKRQRQPYLTAITQNLKRLVSPFVPGGGSFGLKFRSSVPSGTASCPCNIP
jgi:hypothetical protein